MDENATSASAIASPSSSCVRASRKRTSGNVRRRRSTCAVSMVQTGAEKMPTATLRSGADVTLAAGLLDEAGAADRHGGVDGHPHDVDRQRRYGHGGARLQ